MNQSLPAVPEVEDYATHLSSSGNLHPAIFSFRAGTSGHRWTPFPFEGHCYCLTCIDRFSRWPEVFPIPNIEAEMIARTFYGRWIARFGTPLRITTDQGRQFESSRFNQLSLLTGTMHFRTTAYHAQANGIVERFHRQLKDAIRCHEQQRWTEILPSILLGIHAAWREDKQSSAAELVSLWRNHSPTWRVPRSVPPSNNQPSRVCPTTQAPF